MAKIAPKKSKYYQQARDARTGEYTTLAKAKKRPAVTTVSKRKRSRSA